MIIFHSEADGAKLEYTPPRRAGATAALPGVLMIDATNPAVHIVWRMSRGTLVRLALRCLWASVQR
jgi:hypothetical protein